MTVTLTPEAAKYVEQLIRDGRFTRPEDAVLASLSLMRETESFGDFAPGELDRMIEEGERSLADEGGIPAEKVIAELREMSKSRRENRQ